MGRAAGEVVLLPPSQGLLRPRAPEGLPLLPSRHTALALRVSQHQEEEVVCAKLVGKRWRRQQLRLCQGTAKVWKLPGPRAKMDPAERKRGMEEAMWPYGLQILVFII